MLSKEIHKYFFIKPHSFNCVLSDVGFLQIECSTLICTYLQQEKNNRIVIYEIAPVVNQSWYSPE